MDSLLDDKQLWDLLTELKKIPIMQDTGNTKTLTLYDEILFIIGYQYGKRYAENNAPFKEFTDWVKGDLENIKKKSKSVKDEVDMNHKRMEDDILQFDNNGCDCGPNTECWH